MALIHDIQFSIDLFLIRCRQCHWMADAGRHRSRRSRV